MPPSTKAAVRGSLNFFSNCFWLHVWCFLSRLPPHFYSSESFIHETNKESSQTNSVALVEDTSGFSYSVKAMKNGLLNAVILSVYKYPSLFSSIVSGFNRLIATVHMFKWVKWELWKQFHRRLSTLWSGNRQEAPASCGWSSQSLRWRSLPSTYMQNSVWPDWNWMSCTPEG